MNGIDSGFTYGVYERNNASFNGWLGTGGDQNGILLFNVHPGSHTGTTIDGNTVEENRGHGIYLNAAYPATTVSGVTVLNNTANNNERYGIYLYGPVSSTTVNGNIMDGNLYAGASFSQTMSNVTFSWNISSTPCWTFPYIGVSGQGNQCN
jgi:parallel beta-helix repeat protein